MIDIKNKAHEYLINKGVRTIADRFSAKTIEDMLVEFTTQQINNLNIAVVGCCYPHLDREIKDLEYKVNKEGFEDSRDLNSAYQMLLSLKVTKAYLISNCS